ncbi:MAG: nucleotidyltransferase [Christensenella sp.]
MKIAGIIAEYNPFHTGHAYHIAQTREKCGADYIVCVISGNFTQRGEPAIYDKWTRARAALENGADIVLELPFAYATQSAEGFSYGGVSILNALNCVDFISFGTETSNTEVLKQAAQLLTEEPPLFRTALKSALTDGQSFPAARAHALKQCLIKSDTAIFEQPNNILGIEYLKALLQLKSRIEPVFITRADGEYSSLKLSRQFSGARAIRHAIKENNPAFQQFVPNWDFAQHIEPVFSDAMFPFLMFRLRSMSLSDISEIESVSEGLEYRIYEAAKTAKSYSALIEAIKSKRYTYTRIARILLYCMFNITKEKQALLKKEQLYAHVLGVQQKSISLLSQLCAASSIPIITKASEFPDNNLINMDILASDIYALFTKKIAPSKRDFTQKLIII